jgi:hypothetical protein
VLDLMPPGAKGEWAAESARLFTGYLLNRR